MAERSQKTLDITFTQKNNWHILVLSTVEVRKEFTCSQVPTSQLMLGRRWLAIWVHSDSLIKNLSPFEDEAEVC